jgi:ubiquinone/menaquinone biosynthesis C-methylase UbiE
MTAPLIDIYDRTYLNPQINTVVNDYTGRTYPMQQNIPVLLHEYYAGGLNQYRRLYNWLGNSYDATGKLVGKLLHGNGFASVRKAAMAGLQIKNGDRVLLVSVGAGFDPGCFPEDVDINTLHITGTDISLNLLQKFRRQLDKKGIDAQLINCCAEALPFEDNYFDAVFVNGMQFFTDKQQAIQELIRVTGRGGSVVIADEAEGKERKKAIPAAAYLVPGNMEQIAVETYRDNRFYSIGFRKPAH